MDQEREIREEKEVPDAPPTSVPDATGDSGPTETTPGPETPGAAETT